MVENDFKTRKSKESDLVDNISKSCIMKAGASNFLSGLFWGTALTPLMPLIKEKDIARNSGKELCQEMYPNYPKIRTGLDYSYVAGRTLGQLTAVSCIIYRLFNR